MTREEAKGSLIAIKNKYLANYGEDSIINILIDEYDIQAIDMAIQALEQEPSVSENPNKWIPVSERLPEKYTYTLWCASSGYVRSDYFNGEFWKDAKKYCYEVIAWMPLPKPYELPESEE